MDAHCRIEMFGSLRVRQGESLHTRFRTHKAASLLAYLALHLPVAHNREALLERFWPEMDAVSARDNLSTTLSQLRRQLEPVGIPANSILIADRLQVRLNASAVVTDVAEFEFLMHQALSCRQPDRRRELLEQAVSLYQGELLTGSYEDWALQEQTRLQNRYLQGLQLLTHLQEEAGHFEVALATAQRAARTDPYLEEACRAQMRLHLRLKRPAAALEVYETVKHHFQQELGVLPSPITRQMAQRIRQDPNAALLLREPSLPVPLAPSVPGTQAAAHAASTPSPSRAATPSDVTPRDPAPDAVPSAAPSLPPSPTLPLQLTRFVGRRREQRQLLDLLQTPGTRLVTVLGPGGAGKTRLVIEIACQMQALLSERIWFVALADLPDAGLIPSVLIRTLGLPFSTQSDPLDLCVATLAAQPSLLILDNFEHLLHDSPAGKNETLNRGAAILVRLLLERAPALRCVVTSRQALRLEGEQEFLLPPLETPQEKGPMAPEALMSNESVALYVDRARLARVDFALTASNAESVVALCRKLEGMPLAIEMAAAWAKTLPPGRMLERLEQQLELLVSRRRDLPARHQSLRATIAWSYDLLTPELQEAFASLALFRGGWTLEAAEAFCGSDAPTRLAELQERSLIVVEGEDSPRYRMLETLREFGLAKLHEAGAYEALRVQYLDYYLALAQRLYRQFHTPEEKTALDMLAAEHDNLREAIRSGLSAADTIESAIRIAICLVWFWKSRGYIVEGEKWLEKSLQRCPETPTKLRSRLLDAAAILRHQHGDFLGASTLLQEAVAIERQIGNWESVVIRLNNLAIVAYDLGDIALARACWEENLQVSRGQAPDYMLGSTLANLGELAYDEGDMERAQRLLEEAIVVRRRMGDRSYIGHDLGLLGKVACCQGRWAQAEALFTECLLLRSSVEDHPGILEALEGIAGMAALRDQAARAATLFAFTAKARDQMHLPLPPNESREVETHLTFVRTLLPAGALEAAWQEGQTWTQEQACSHALTYI